MAETLTLGSLFDGSGGFPLAGLGLGITPVWASEVAPFPIRVTTKRIPQMRHLGDINLISGAGIPPVDIITAGFPCTDVSCAGRRAGIHAARSGLFFQAVRVIREMMEASENSYPKYLCFENVPGLLSSGVDEKGCGADFREVMDEIAALGFISDPNILDAADFGVAQRRKRVFIAAINRKFYDPADFADAPKARDKRMEKAIEVWGGETFYGVASRPYIPVRQRLSEMLQNDVDPKYYLSAAACLGILRRAESRGKALPDLLRYALESQAGLWADVLPESGYTACFEPGAASRRGGHVWHELSGTLRADPGDNLPAVVYDARGNGDSEVVCTLSGDHENRVTDYTALAVEPVASFMGGQGSKAGSIAYSEKVAPTLRGQGGGNAVPMVMTAYGISSYESEGMKSDNPHSGIYEAETSRTLDSGGANPGCNQGGIAVVAFAQNERDEVRDLHDRAGALAAQPGMKQQTFIMRENGPAYAMTVGSFMQVCEEQSPTLQARDYKDAPAVARPEYVVRRLTPRECAVLQGFDPAYCDGLETPEPAEEDIAFWSEVWETHRRVMGASSKSKSRNQIVKWLRDPYNDSAVYSLWGNGVCKNVVEFVLDGIVQADQKKLSPQTKT